LTSREEATAQLAAIGSLDDEAIDLAEAGLLLGALDDAMSGLARCRWHLSALLDRAIPLAAAAQTAPAQAQLLSQILYEEAGYEGDRAGYDHPQNANLIRVIERRRGLPVALGLLYIDLGGKLGWTVRGLSLPGHFVIRVSAAEDRVILDPFHGGAPVETPQLRLLLKRAMGPEAELQPGHLAEIGKREVLLRLQNNLKSRALAERKLERAAIILERMSLIAPAEAPIWYERGLVESEIGHLAAASRALNACLERAGDRRLRQNAEAALARLRRQLN
jgi:regulator of sirC expression with transglutaminase-like and TPR domain